MLGCAFHFYLFLKFIYDKNIFKFALEKRGFGREIS